MRFQEADDGCERAYSLTGRERRGKIVIIVVVAVIIFIVVFIFVIFALVGRRRRERRRGSDVADGCMGWAWCPCGRCAGNGTFSGGDQLLFVTFGRHGMLRLLHAA